MFAFVRLCHVYADQARNPEDMSRFRVRRASVALHSQASPDAKKSEAGANHPGVDGSDVC